MVMGYGMGLPGKLEKLSPALGLKAEKDMKGGRIMLQLSQPRKVNEGQCKICGGSGTEDLYHACEACNGSGDEIIFFGNIKMLLKNLRPCIPTANKTLK